LLGNSIVGPQGNSSTITIGNTNTLSSGSNATVTNTGTSLNPILNFGIPQGSSITGPSGISCLYVGVFVYGTLYVYNNIVFYNGSSYLCLIDNVNIYPDSDILKWALIAQKGDQGQSIVGPQGEPGKNGSNGSNSSDSVGLIATNVAIGVVATNLAALDVIVTTHTANLAIINPELVAHSATLGIHTTEIDALQVKTTDLNYDLIGSSFSRSLAVGSLIDLNSTNGQIVCDNLQLANSSLLSNGDINVKNITSNGNINTNHINTNEITTSIDVFGIKTTNIESNTINIGTDSFLNNVNIGNSFSNVTIRCYNNAPLNISNFINQF
jgi:hypothetical protein